METVQTGEMFKGMAAISANVSKAAMDMHVILWHGKVGHVTSDAIEIWSHVRRRVGLRRWEHSLMSAPRLPIPPKMCAVRDMFTELHARQKRRERSTGSGPVMPCCASLAGGTNRHKKIQAEKQQGCLTTSQLLRQLLSTLTLVSPFPHWYTTPQHQATPQTGNKDVSPMAYGDMAEKYAMPAMQEFVGRFPQALKTLRQQQLDPPVMSRPRALRHLCATYMTPFINPQWKFHITSTNVDKDFDDMVPAVKINAAKFICQRIWY
ncbi:hypothetical protein BT69DRAFT_1301793 [Atractiella rhizophila]|nr:hypothetical protein BT69DRAFT_1301793 [Atractiella rhizophila]